MKKYLTIVYFTLSILIWAQEKLVVEYESKMIFDLDNTMYMLYSKIF